MTVDSPTRREFERLERLVNKIDEHGSRRVEGLSVQVEALSREVASLEEKVESVSRALWTLVAVVLTGMVSMIVALASGALGA